MSLCTKSNRSHTTETIIWVTSSGKSQHETSILSHYGYSVLLCRETQQCIDYIKKHGTTQYIVGIITSMMERGGRKRKGYKNGVEMIEHINKYLLSKMKTKPVFAINSSSIDTKQCINIGVDIIIKPQTTKHSNDEIQQQLIKKIKQNKAYSISTNIKPQSIRNKAPDIHLNRERFEYQDYNDILHLNNDEKTQKRIHIVHISDTHKKYAQFTNIIPFKKGDINILIHSGDFSGKYDKNDVLPKRVIRFSKWFRNLPHHKKIIIAGNHDYICSDLSKQQIKSIVFKDDPTVIYLEDDMVNVYGINIYGTPWNHQQRMSFGLNQEKMKQKWKLIPNHTDIVISHQPPFSKYLEHKLCKRKRGNVDLWNEIINRIKPSCHLFGHDHDYVGYKRYKKIMFINSAMDFHAIPHEFDVIFDLK